MGCFGSKPERPVLIQAEKQGIPSKLATKAETQSTKGDATPDSPSRKGSIPQSRTSKKPLTPTTSRPTSTNIANSPTSPASARSTRAGYESPNRSRPASGLGSAPSSPLGPGLRPGRAAYRHTASHSLETKPTQVRPALVQHHSATTATELRTPTRPTLQERYSAISTPTLTAPTRKSPPPRNSPANSADLKRPSLPQRKSATSSIDLRLSPKIPEPGDRSSSGYLFGGPTSYHGNAYGNGHTQLHG